MQLKIKRRCRFRRFLIFPLLSIIVFFILIKSFIYSPSNLDFIELNSCPACFGVHLCPLFGTPYVQLSGWQRFSFFNNDMFNVKNIYHGTLHNHSVIFKKMAHQSEWITFDNCHYKSSCFRYLKSPLSTLLPCSNITFISKFRNAFILSTDFDPNDSEISFQVTSQINLEPIVLSSLSGSGLPFPFYYGSCGRVAFLARELLISMYELNNNNSEMIIYYPDVNLENFVYNEYERRVKIIDLELVIIVEREFFLERNNENRLSGNQYCRTYMPDFNIEQVCRYILSKPSKTNGLEMSSDFLHDIPDDIDHEFPKDGAQNQSDTTNNQSTIIDVEKDSDIKEFLNEIETIQSVINRLDTLTEQAKQIHFTMLQPTANPKSGQELDNKTEEIKKLSYETSAKLKKMEQSLEHQSGLDITNAQRRIKESHLFVLTRHFRNVMIEYNQEAVLHRERCTNVISRELALSGVRKSHDELEEILENGSSGTFDFSVMVKTQQAQQSLNAIEARHRDIIKIETSIKELHNMFRDLAILVADQGEMIDSIEHNVAKAANYVEVAAKDVNIVTQYVQNIRKKKIILVTIIVSVSVIFILIIFISSFLRKKTRAK
ncbi:unnamed protein product [Adineta steineri]|uniref:t-SNARE coiled-coil homology domain-containing protein n=1 Tax=Adineta steineri TaxID=433720 RepID=A0A819BLT8_9BILA|nr:unnamed protein product [Adineta steineri]